MFSSRSFFICLEVPFQYSFEHLCTLGLYLHHFDLHHRFACCFIGSVLDSTLSDVRLVLCVAVVIRMDVIFCASCRLGAVVAVYVFMFFE